MLPEKRLVDYVIGNEKCKVLVKLVKGGEGAPGREPVMSEDARLLCMNIGVWSN